MAEELLLDGDSEKVTPDKALVAKANVSPELFNLASELDDERCKAIAAKVIEDWRTDEASRTDWLAMKAKWLELYYQRDKTIPPFKGASQESLPLLTEACNQFQARAFKALFPGRQFVSGMVVGKPDAALTQRADRVGKFMSWQLGVLDRPYKRNKNALLLSAAIHGSVFTKTYYDPLRRKNVVRNVRAEDLVIPYGVGPRLMSEVERVTETIWTSVNETRRLTQIGFFVCPAVEAQGHEIEGRPTTTATNTATGTQPTSLENSGRAFLLEQHLNLDLDGDGITEPYIAVVDVEAEKLMRLAIRYEVDEAGAPTNGKEPVEYYTHYQFFPNPEGFYGLGLGFILMAPNLAVNKLLRLMIDSAVLATAGNMSGVISDQVALEKGEFELELGKFKKVNASAEEIAKGIWSPKFPGPNAALATAITWMVNEARKLSTVTDVVSGDVDKVLQPTTMLEMVEQSSQVFSSVQEFIMESWTDELMKLYRLNHKYLREDMWITVTGANGPEAVRIGRADFGPDLLVLPMADPRMTTQKQKQQQAQAIWQLALSNPFTANNPEAVMRAHQEVLKAAGVEDVDRFTPPPPPPGPDPEMQALELKKEEIGAKIQGKEKEIQLKLVEGKQKMQLSAAESQQKMATDRAEFQHKAQMAQQEHGLEMQKTAMQARVETAQMQQQGAIQAAGAKQDLVHKEQAHKQSLKQGEEKNKAAIAAQKAKAAAKPKAK